MKANRNEIARILGVTPNYVNRLVDRGMPASGDLYTRTYDVDKCIDWYKKFKGWKEWF